MVGRLLIASPRLSSSFVYIWVYDVLPEKVEDFRRLYGPNGRWVALFRQASGYLDTQLLHDRTRDNRFVTIDRWESHQAVTAFRAKFADEFDRLDELGAQMTADEALLGEFDLSG